MAAVSSCRLSEPGTFQVYGFCFIIIDAFISTFFAAVFIIAAVIAMNPAKHNPCLSIKHGNTGGKGIYDFLPCVFVSASRTTFGYEQVLLLLYGY